MYFQDYAFLLKIYYLDMLEVVWTSYLQYMIFVSSVVDDSDTASSSIQRSAVGKSNSMIVIFIYGSLDVSDHVSKIIQTAFQKALCVNFQVKIRT